MVTTPLLRKPIAWAFPDPLLSHVAQSNVDDDPNLGAASSTQPSLMVTTSVRQDLIIPTSTTMAISAALPRRSSPLPRKAVDGFYGIAFGRSLRRLRRGNQLETSASIRMRRGKAAAWNGGRA